MELNEFKGKKLLILGLGREGLDTLNCLLKWAPEVVCGVADSNTEEKISDEAREAIKGAQISRHFGAGYLSKLDDYDIIVKSPGIPIHIPEIESAFKKNKITSQTQIFFDHCRGTIVGVTGTKGKSTTASLINAVLVAGGYDSQLIGNIGQPALLYLEESKKDNFYVYELSAHQLYGLTKSPHIGALTNLYPEHLDYYSDFNEYIRAKGSIAIHQSRNDYFIYNSEISECRDIAAKCGAKKIAYNENDWKPNCETKLKGNVNLGNMKIAAIVGDILGINISQIERAICNFKPLPHRLESVGVYNGIEFYNDSLSTIQESAVAAIESLGGDLQTLIAGGYDRSQPFDKLARSILDSRIDNLILFAPTGQRIWDELLKMGHASSDSRRLDSLKRFFVSSMDEAVNLAFKHTASARICLMSSASASFGEFRDYAQRGEAFKCSIVKLSKA